ncbi:MAG: hypothetical protein QXH27_03790 [Candidatus Micrarchaeia archaeon]
MRISLRLTMESGQPPEFLWQKTERGYARKIGGRTCEVWSEGDRLCFTPGFEREINTLFRAQDDLAAIEEAVATDRIMRLAFSRYRGLRITETNPWETMVCFICSINNNIPRIKRMVQGLMRDGCVLPPEEMARAHLAGLKLGFREKFLKQAAKKAIGFDWSALRSADFDKAKRALMDFPGVGDKVADCILLFGLGRLEAFPVDVWIRRAMRRYYGQRTIGQIHSFAKKKWSPLAGYAQQYLYCLARACLPSAKSEYIQ